jgi:hypothetical protein
MEAGSQELECFYNLKSWLGMWLGFCENLALEERTEYGEMVPRQASRTGGPEEHGGGEVQADLGSPQRKEVFRWHPGDLWKGKSEEQASSFWSPSLEWEGTHHPGVHTGCPGTTPRCLCRMDKDAGALPHTPVLPWQSFFLEVQIHVSS